MDAVTRHDGRVGTGAAGSRYRRLSDLPQLIRMWPAEIAAAGPAGQREIVERLRQALRSERRRGLAGDWTYDLTRHAALLLALKHETARLAADCKTQKTSAQV